MISLESPRLMAGAFVALAIALWLHRRASRAGPPALSFSGLGDLVAVRGRRRDVAGAMLFTLKVAALVTLAIALGRPRLGHTVLEVLTPGVDIVVTLDLSGSMRAEDMGDGVNRIQAARKVVKDFITGRSQDRIGLVIFAVQAFTQCPLTLDYPLLLSLVDGLNIGTIKEDSTAIGMGIATALARLKESKAKSRIIILVTDGRNNAGALDPLTAADLAKGMGVRVYTVGIGGRGPAPYPIDDPRFGRRYVTIPDDLNEDELEKIAQATGGIFRRATNPKALEGIFQEISRLEKSDIKAKTYTLYDELFSWLLWPAFVAVLLEIALATTVFRRIP
jgi:Ca-activated chloride channel family protein